MAVKVAAWSPVPLSDTCCVVPVLLLSVKVRVPLFAPGEVGAKATSSVQLAPGDTEPTQFVVVVNCELAATLLTLSGAFPVLLSVTGCVALVVPTVWLPKFRVVGETEAVGVPE
jgi:hypothetical protein